MQLAIHGFLSTLLLVSRIPVKLSKEPNYNLVGLWMPLVGLIAAAVACIGAAFGTLLFGRGMLTAIMAMAFQYWLFNLFHVDGMLDTADALGVNAFGEAGIEKRRAALKDSRIGAYAFFVGFIYLSARLSAINTISTINTIALYGALCFAPVVGRFACVLVPSLIEPYKNAGLGALIGRPSPIISAFGYVLGVIPAAILFAIEYGAFAIILCIIGGGLIAIVSAMIIALWYKKNMGGYSGDALGAVIELAETLALVSCVAIF